jgi:hypothetical protein
MAERGRALELQLHYQRLAEAQIASLTAERDALRSTAEERERELDRLRHEVTQSQAALDARTGELEELRLGKEDRARQVEELREIVRELERERDSFAHRHTAIEAELEEEQRQAREAVTRASREHGASREDLAEVEELLRTARQECADVQGLAEGLRQTIDEERSRNALLEKQIQSQMLDISRLNAAVQAVQTLLNEITGVLDSEEPAIHSQEGWAVARPILEVFLETLGSAHGPAKQPLRLVADKASVRKRVTEIAELGRRFLREREQSEQREQQLREENERLSVQLAAAKRGPESAPETQSPVFTRDRHPRMSEVVAERRPRGTTLPPASGGRQEESPESALSSSAAQKASQRRRSLSGMPVECMLENSGAETMRILRGEIGRINTLGLIAAFDEQFPEGRRVLVRFAVDGEAFSFLGRVVRVQLSAALPDAPVIFHHVIRFESMVSGSRETLQAIAI